MPILPLALGVLALLSGTAGAQEACRAGTSRLPDERALVAVRAATESSCPCASALSRGKYRRCAKAAIDAAIDGATLRAECRKDAIRIAKGATCGTTQVACGSYDADGRVPVSCKTLPPARCVDKPSKEQNACSEETHCADVVEWTGATCTDPRSDGPFAAGFRLVTFTKPSFLDPETDRVLETVIWYPAPPGSGPINNTYRGVQDAPLDLSAGPYPIIMFSHGSCGYPSQSRFLTPMLATYGFIVAAPPHPGNTLAEFPDCGTPGAQGQSAVERPRDIIYVLDQMLAADGDSLSPFFGAIDETRIGMMGHSFGGFTTYRVLDLDTRFDVAVPLAPAVPGSPVVTVPSLHMLGQLDSLVNNPSIQTAYANAASPKHLIEIRDAGHFAFSDLCFPGPDCQPPTTLTQPESHAIVRRWVLPFMKVYLAGDTSFAPFLATSPSTGVLYFSEP
jgi:predicted dienelactone hydrolase